MKFLGRADEATASDLAHLYDIPVGTIYRWASLDGWRRSDPKRRPVTYNRDDAEKSYRDRRCGGDTDSLDALTCGEV